MTTNSVGFTLKMPKRLFKSAEKQILILRDSNNSIFALVFDYFIIGC
jgi:hypothetical protein